MHSKTDNYFNRIRALNIHQRKLLSEQISAIDSNLSKPTTNSVSKLTAYVVTQKNKPIDADAIRTSITSQIPDYMVPSDIILMDSFPLTPSGKVDRRSLPKPDKNRDVQNENLVAPETQLEKKIAGLWGDVLGYRQVSMADNFFELGGDSLLAVKFFALMKNSGGYDLPLAILFEAPTLQRLVDKIENEQDKNHPSPSLGLLSTPNKARTNQYNYKVTDDENHLWRALVAIKPEGRLLPLFLVHGIGGNVLNYSRLIPYLNKEQPVYGLQARGLDGQSQPFQSVSEMAAHYISEIQSVQPQGPYLLGGGSMGGALALEMAQQLLDKGQRIIFVGLFDTISPFAKYTKVSIAAKIKAFYQSNTRLYYLLQRKYKYYLKKSKNIFFPPICGLYRFIKRPIPPFFRYWFIEQENRTIMMKYTPKPFRERITLFRSTFADDDGPDRGWGDIAENGLDIIQIPAGHRTFIESPELGKALSTYLDKVQKISENASSEGIELQ